MIRPPITDLQAQAFEVWGMDGQVTKLVEECAELIQAIAANDPLEEIHQEMVGVQSVLNSVWLGIDQELTSEQMTEIEQEQAERLKAHLRAEIWGDP